MHELFVKSVNFNYDGKFIISGSWDDTIKICNEKKGIYLDIETDFEEFCMHNGGSNYAKNRYSMFVDNAHFSETGHKLISKLIYEKIEMYLK